MAWAAAASRSRPRRVAHELLRHAASGSRREGAVRSSFSALSKSFRTCFESGREIGEAAGLVADGMIRLRGNGFVAIGNGILELADLDEGAAALLPHVSPGRLEP